MLQSFYGLRARWLGAALISLCLSCALAAPLSHATKPGPSSLGTIDPGVFELAIGAAAQLCRSLGTVTDPSTLTVIDYSRPSTAKRLWVFDLRSQELLYEELVAHGQGSGDNLARVFSKRTGITSNRALGSSKRRMPTSARTVIRFASRDSTPASTSRNRTRHRHTRRPVPVQRRFRPREREARPHAGAVPRFAKGLPEK